MTNIFEAYALTERENDIVQLVAAGLPNGKIASKLGIAHNTVKVHLSNVYRKTGTNSRHDLIALANSEISGFNALDVLERGDTLQVLVTVFVPSTADRDVQLSDSDHVARQNEVATYFSNLAGGATVNGISFGSWVSDDLGLVKEPVAKVESLTDYANIDEILRQVETWRDAWSQECIMVTVQPTIGYFI